jgi:hypothetical protein
MSKELQYNPACSRSRWLGYFDLLGTRQLIRSGDPSRVFWVYERAVREVTDWNSRLPQIQHAWFSDTFLIYSESDAASDFVQMDMISRWFVFFLILAEIPVRGAIACGGFYADTSNQVYLGQALVEAYEFGEAQDWIGFLLCPSAVVRLDEVGLPAGKLLNYAYSEIPSKKEMSPKRLPACILGSWNTTNGENQLVRSLSDMKAKQLESSIARKYENTITFIEQNQRWVSQNGQPGAAPTGGPGTQVGKSRVTEGPPSVS